MPTKSPTLLRRQVAAELRRLREHSGLTVGQAARELGWHESKLSRIETGAAGVRRADLEHLLTFLGVPESERSRLVTLGVQSRQRGWWEPYGQALSGGYATYIGFEAEASRILTYQPLLIFGLLQTAEYASAVLNATELPADSPDLIAQRVTARLARQAVLTRDPRPYVHVILDEAALLRPIGGPDAMRRQILRLIELGEPDEVTIQILEMSAGAHGGLDGAFVVLEFAGDNEPPLAYSEGLIGGVIRDRADDLARYYACFEALRAAALSAEDSRDFLITRSRGDPSP